ncbi:MAG: complex I NDUFA9 subunit family protein [Novosphingobium sp.]
MARPKEGMDLYGKVIAVLGGSGFLGQHLAQELMARGARLRIASRNPERAHRIKPLAALGQIQFTRCDVTRPASLVGALAGADAVVNLVGAFSGDLDALQGNGTRRIAEAAQAAGVSALVHVSAIGADADAEVDYARSKGDGERAVLAAFPAATILRPSILFGPDDNFVMMFGRLIAMLPVLPVFGPAAKLQPVFVDDVAQAIGALVADAPRHAGQTFEAAGPEAITMLEFNQRIAAAQQRKRMFVELPDAVSSAVASLTGWAPGAPITSDQWALLKQGNVASGSLPGLAQLGIAPRPLGLFLDRWMVQFRKHGRFGETQSPR